MHTTTTTTGTGYDLRHGLTLQETAHGLTVCGHPHRQYKARHELKRHGAHWNARARQWEATTPHDCDTLRRWLTHQEPTTATAALLWLMVAALVYVVFTYNFTIPAYK